MNKCLVCEHEIAPFVDFGMMPIANGFIWKKDEDDGYRFPMKVGFCDHCTMVQMLEQPDRERMFHESYAFLSSSSVNMQRHFSAAAANLIDEYSLSGSSYVVEIGCNDGIFIENFVKASIPCTGVEPSGNVAKMAQEKGVPVVNKFFDRAVAADLFNASHHGADVIFSANVICHIKDIHEIFGGVKELLSKNGVFVYEDPYLGDVLAKSSFDQIYDEHVFLFSAHSVQHLASVHGLRLFKCEPQGTHGGSMRYFICHDASGNHADQLSSILANERSIGLNRQETFTEFKAKIDEIGNDLTSLLVDLKSQGKKVVGYGATSKSTTSINYFGITLDMLSCIYDTSPTKINKLTPGAHIPILPYSEFRDSDPDVVLLFAWNHAEEIFEKEADFMIGNKKWITYVPKVEMF